MQHFSSHIDNLIENLAYLPGVGRKTAQRLAFHIINMDDKKVAELAEAILKAKDNLTYCETCYNLADTSPCSICSNPSRDHSIICVVSDPRDVAAMERTLEYNGLYHVLHGTMSPMENITAEMLKIKELMLRLGDRTVQEVILATNPTIDGEATAMYISRFIKMSHDIKVTRIAHGLPVGGDLEYADSVTIAKAMEGRREI